MGRTLVVRGLLVVLFVLACVGAPARGDSYALGTETMAGDWDDLDAWLQQLCKVVQCDELRVPTDGAISPSDYAALRFVLAYQTYGVQPVVNRSELLTAQSATARCLDVLADGSTSLDPDIEAALIDALLSLQIDLGS